MPTGNQHRRALIGASAVIVALLVVTATATAGVTPALFTQTQDDGEFPPATDNVSDPEVDYDKVDYSLALTSGNNSTVDYSISILGAVQPVNETANGTVECAEQACYLNGSVGPDEIATYRVSGAIVDVTPDDNLSGAVSGQFEGNGLEGIGLGAVFDDQQQQAGGSGEDARPSDADAGDGTDEDTDAGDGASNGAEDDADGDVTDGGGAVTDGTDGDRDGMDGTDGDVTGGPDGNVTDGDGMDDTDGDVTDGTDGNDTSNDEAAVSITYLECSTVSLNGSGEYSAVVDYEYYISNGNETRRFENTYDPEVTLPDTLNLANFDQGALSEVVVTNVRLSDEDGLVTEKVNPNLDECRDDAISQAIENASGGDS